MRKMQVPKEAFDAISKAADECHSIFCLEQLGVPHRVANLLYDRGVKSVADLVSMSQEQILAIPNFGKLQLKVVLDALANYHTIEDV